MGGLSDIFGGGPTTQTDMFGGSSQPAAQTTDLFGGSNDLFGSGPSVPSFPQFIAFEDDVIQLGYEFKRDQSQPGGHIITGHFKNKTGTALTGVNMQVAAQKYMTLKMKPATGTSLGPHA